MTNLNEDTQLSGKVYYALSGLADKDVIIGRIGSECNPEIALRGISVQNTHATFKVCPDGQIKLVVSGEEAHKNTLINGEQLPPAKENFHSMASNDLLGMEGSQNFSQILNHMDRICIGGNLLFLFRYPLKRFMKEKILTTLYLENQNADSDELERL